MSATEWGAALTLGLLGITSSLTGSLHCGIMCGPLVSRFHPTSVGAFKFHVARWITYVGLGLLAAVIGRELFEAAWIEALSIRTLTALSAIGLGFILITRSVQIMGSLRAPLLTSGSPLKLGFLSGFSGCSWLSTFILLSAGTMHPMSGMALMTGFWVGTLPALAFSHVVQKSLVKFKPSLQSATRICTAIILVVVAGLHIYRGITQGLFPKSIPSQGLPHAWICGKI